MSEDRTKYCPYCGVMIPYKEKYCPACGNLQPILGEAEKTSMRPKKSALLAVILSLLVTGLGQIYLGKWRRGLTFLFGTLFIGAMLSYFYSYDQVFGIGIILAIISAYDAYRIAHK
jgi:TM2 domain-containing membrane protein YozV